MSYGIHLRKFHKKYLKFLSLIWIIKLILQPHLPGVNEFSKMAFWLADCSLFGIYHILGLYYLSVIGSLMQRYMCGVITEFFLSVIFMSVFRQALLWYGSVQPSVHLSICVSSQVIVYLSDHDDVIKWKHFLRNWPFVLNLSFLPHKFHIRWETY